MVSKGLAGLLAGGSCLLLTTLARAECQMDNDCAGDLVCEKGACVAAAPSPAPAPAAEPAPEPSPEAEPPKPKMRRHSKGMMVGGIVMTSVGGISLFVSGLMAIGSVLCNTGNIHNERERYDECNYTVAIYTPLGIGLGLIAAGIPTLVIGAKSEPVGVVRLTPWATPQSGGLSLRLDL